VNFDLILRKARWRKLYRAACPRCNSDRIKKKDGLYIESTIKNISAIHARHGFNYKAGTISFVLLFARKPLNTWFLARPPAVLCSSSFSGLASCSILRISREFLIPCEIRYRMIRTVLERIWASTLSNHSMLKTKVESGRERRRRRALSNLGEDGEHSKKISR
jgi:hypothetical protein